MMRCGIAEVCLWSGQGSRTEGCGCAHKMTGIEERFDMRILRSLFMMLAQRGLNPGTYEKCPLKMVM